MQWGEQEEFLLQIQEETGKPNPTLQTKPVLDEALILYSKGFFLLSDSRPIHMGGVGHIPISEIYAYLKLVGIQDVDSRLTFLEHIKKMDSIYVNHHNTKKSET